MDAKEILFTKGTKIFGDIAHGAGGGAGSDEPDKSDAIGWNGDGNPVAAFCSYRGRYLGSSNHSVNLRRDRRVAAIKSEPDVGRRCVFQYVAAAG
ncbi:hypothetical protein NKI31_30465 [Mesorhizobium sp. M0659]|uniref:hypothetical protein n=1 Tax=Mesorhizobium sp. M0659 TaxID=2956980 RepID=UPI00333B414F